MKRILLIEIIIILSVLAFFINVPYAKDIVLNPVWSRGDQDDNISFNHPNGFCIGEDSQYIYIADTGNDRIVILSIEGEFAGIFLTSVKVERPYDVICSTDGLIYISQMSKAKIDVFDKKGVYLFSIPKGRGYDGLRPGRMAFDSRGMLVFGDRANGEIFLIDPEGSVKKRFTHDDRGDLLTGVWAGADGNIYSSWALGIAVRIFDQAGKALFLFGQHRLIEDGFSFPSSLTLDKEGRIWIIDTLRHRVKVFSPDGKYLFQTGKTYLQFPIDIEFDKNGRVYILEKGGGRIRAFLLGQEE